MISNKTPDASTAPVIPSRAYILAGGASQRFGTNKARAIIHGQPILSHLCQELFQRGFIPTVVCNREDKYEDLELLTIVDDVPGVGPLGGLHASLVDLERHNQSSPLIEERILILACDLAWLPHDWVDRLIASISPSADISLIDDGQRQPMPAIYHRRILPILESQLKRKQHGLMKFLSRPELNLQIHNCDGLKPLPRFNTPQELKVWLPEY